MLIQEGKKLKHKHRLYFDISYCFVIGGGYAPEAIAARINEHYTEGELKYYKWIDSSMRVWRRPSPASMADYNNWFFKGDYVSCEDLKSKET